MHGTSFSFVLIPPQQMSLFPHSFRVVMLNVYIKVSMRSVRKTVWGSESFWDESFYYIIWIRQFSFVYTCWVWRWRFFFHENENPSDGMAFFMNYLWRLQFYRMHLIQSIKNTTAHCKRKFQHSMCMKVKYLQYI